MYSANLPRAHLHTHTPDIRVIAVVFDRLIRTVYLLTYCEAINLRMRTTVGWCDAMGKAALYTQQTYVRYFFHIEMPSVYNSRDVLRKFWQIFIFISP